MHLCRSKGWEACCCDKFGHSSRDRPLLHPGASTMCSRHRESCTACLTTPVSAYATILTRCCHASWHGRVGEDTRMDSACADHTCRGESYAVDCVGKNCQCANISGGRAVSFTLFDLHVCFAAIQSVLKCAGMSNKGQGERELRVCRAPCPDFSPPRPAQRSAICQHTHGIYGKTLVGGQVVQAL